MKFLLVAALAGLCAVSAVSVGNDYHHEYNQQRQKEIYRLFKYINQPSYYPDHVEISNSYKFWEHKSDYTKPEVVDEFYNYFYYGKYLHRGEIFSVFHKEHLYQAIALFKLFYYANTYETFYHTAVWARNHVNEGMYLYAVSVALVHRPDTYYYALPPIYEVYPYYFYSTEVIQEAQYYKQLYRGADGAKYNDQTIYANYSGYYLNLHPEQALSYFTEDVGVNSFYYYYNLYYPFWMSGEEFNLKYDNRGEVFYYMYQQILARYYLERLSNGFGEIDHFNWEVPFETGYYPNLCYPNGLQFPSRPNYAHLYEYFYNYGQKYGYNKYAYSYTFVKDYERRIRDVIDSGYVYTKSGDKVDLFSHEGLNILGNLVEGNPDSPYYHYYGAYHVFARHLLGYSFQPLTYRKVYPSALEHFETSMRDPAFYQLYKKLITYFFRYKAQHYKYYTEHDLAFEGVEVKNVEFDRLVTYFDYYFADISSAVYVTPEEFVQDSFKVQVAQHRLNYKPFTYKIYVDSSVDTDAVVKVFFGPKYDEYGRYINLTENWMNFVQFDHFVYKLKSGQNVITRNSREIFNYMHDRTSYYQLYQKAMGVSDDEHRGSYHHTQFWFGFPQRFYLPKGTYGGFPYQFYVFVTKHVPYKNQKSEVPVVGSGYQYVDGYPMGYPFDRPVYYGQVFYEIPNGYFYETKVYHRDADAVNYSQQEYYNKQNYYQHHQHQYKPQHYNSQYNYAKQYYPQGQYYKGQNYDSQYYHY
ncbi:arylphorin subunit alpha-like [Tribolium madens]|uniref:arylphorin subunit alpha-like n=1 Tax=Tribolium madens TaxID=41895 RepID=UPI001CF73DFE|nr:arylphorin subunit alpha-like [Tribolium madens]